MIEIEEAHEMSELVSVDSDKESSPDANDRHVVGEQTSNLLEIIRECIAERKGRDTVVLDLTKVTPIADYFVICSGTSSMHARAISEHIEFTCKKAGFMRLGIEGEKNARWILIDYGDVVVHIFLDETRWFYNLERLWGDARRVEHESE